jgi:hypothetical protein
MHELSLVEIPEVAAPPADHHQRRPGLDELVGVHAPAWRTTGNCTTSPDKLDRAAKIAKAMELRAQRRSYEQIAEEIGVCRSYAFKLVDRDVMVKEQLDAYRDPRQWCDWSFFARDEQIAPTGDWATWLYLAGRGSGKTGAGPSGCCGRCAKAPASST